MWGALSTSLFGSAITALAFPLMAITLLDASATQMGLLVAAETAPFFLWSLLAGVWVDRRLRRPILIATDLARAGLLLSVPLAAWFGLLRIEQMYLVAFVTGTLGVFFEIAHYAYVPALVGRDRVVEANSKIQISHSAAEAGGPGAAGLLIQAVSAPVALIVDAVTYLVSALLLRQIRTIEPPIERTPSMTPATIRQDVADGMRMLLRHRLLRPIVLASVAGTIFLTAIQTLYVLYASRDLGISPLAIGLIFTIGGLGTIPGALISERVARRFGVGPTIIGGWLIYAASWLLVPLADGLAAFPVLAAGMLLGGVAMTVYNIQQWSLRQIVTPDDLQGRVTAGHRFLVYGSAPLGALLGGSLGAMAGLRPAMTICALAGLAAPLWLARSPLRHLRDQPTAETA
jgi:MFS family permease